MAKPISGLINFEGFIEYLNSNISDSDVSGEKGEFKQKPANGRKIIERGTQLLIETNVLTGVEGLLKIPSDINFADISVEKGFIEPIEQESDYSDTYEKLRLTTKEFLKLKDKVIPYGSSIDFLVEPGIEFNSPINITITYRTQGLFFSQKTDLSHILPPELFLYNKIDYKIIQNP